MQSEQNDSQITRRGVLKMAGAIAGLAAGLGVGVNEAGAAATNEATQIQIKFWRLPANGDERYAELLGAFPMPLDMQRRFMKQMKGQMQLKLTYVRQSGKVKNNVPEPPDGAVMTKQAMNWDPNQVRVALKLSEPQYNELFLR